MRLGDISSKDLRRTLRIEADEDTDLIPWAVQGVLEQGRHDLDDGGLGRTRIVLEGAGQLTRYEFDPDHEVEMSGPGVVRGPADVDVELVGSDDLDHSATTGWRNGLGQ